MWIVVVSLLVRCSFLCLVSCRVGCIVLLGWCWSLVFGLCCVGWSIGRSWLGWCRFWWRLGRLVWSWCVWLVIVVVGRRMLVLGWLVCIGLGVLLGVWVFWRGRSWWRLGWWIVVCIWLCGWFLGIGLLDWLGWCWRCVFGSCCNVVFLCNCVVFFLCWWWRSWFVSVWWSFGWWFFVCWVGICCWSLGVVSWFLGWFGCCGLLVWCLVVCCWVMIGWRCILGVVFGVCWCFVVVCVYCCWVGWFGYLVWSWCWYCWGIGVGYFWCCGCCWCLLLGMVFWIGSFLGFFWCYSV